MAIYVALLRGINVGGRRKVAMEDLRRVFQELGFTDARTFIQSGNVIFSGPASAARLAHDLEQRIARDIGTAPTVLLRTKQELGRVIAANPFLAHAKDHSRLHVTFLVEKPAAAAVKALVRPAGETGEFALRDREVYLHVPDGYGTSKLGNAFFEKRLGVSATTRNWNTVTKLFSLAGGDGTP
jgi:uncharacterized protein (DUF1697 family)